MNSFENKFDIICFSESWLTTHSAKFYDFDNYSSFHSLREAETFLSHGGVSAYISRELIATKIDCYSMMNPNIESLFLNVHKNNKQFILGVVYRPPNSDCKIFNEKLDEIISSLNHSNYKDCIICGDFNLNMLNYIECNNTVKFMNIMNSASLIPVISKPSRITENSATLIDNIFTNQPLHFDSGLFTCDFSDHLPLFLNLKDFFTNPDSLQGYKEIKYRFIDENSYSNLENYLSNHDFSLIENSECLDKALIDLDQIILEAYNKFCPIKIKKISFKDLKKPWISNDIKILIKKRFNLYILYRTHKISYYSFTRYRNFVTSRIRDAKKTYYENKFTEFKHNARESWKIINSIIRNKTKSDPVIKKLIVDDITFEEPKDIANILNDHFSKVGSKIAQSFKSDINDHRKYLNNPKDSSFFFCPVLPQDVKIVILNLKSKKPSINSYGIDVLKYLSNVISPVLASLINRSVTSGTFPQSLKLAKLIPLPKPGLKTDANNYRPISILPVLSKIFEKIMYKQLYHYLEKNSILYKHQYGFRQNHSTTQAILNNLKFLYDSLNSGKLVISIFLDFKKAFDCVSHEILLSKLSHYGIRGISLDWFTSYLSGRKQYTLANNVHSKVQNITHGVPQGSILGPLLFLIFINDIPNSSKFFNYTLFADDSTLSVDFENKNLSLFVKRVNKELKLIDSWLCANKICINILKTKYIVFSIRKSIKMPGIIKIGKGKIKSVNNIKFLGVHIDRHLTFNSHINYLSTKISRSVGLIYKLNNYLPYSVLLKIYHALIHPYFNYAMQT